MAEKKKFHDVQHYDMSHSTAQFPEFPTSLQRPLRLTLRSADDAEEGVPYWYGIFDSINPGQKVTEPDAIRYTLPAIIHWRLQVIVIRFYSDFMPDYSALHWRSCYIMHDNTVMFTIFYKSGRVTGCVLC